MRRILFGVGALLCLATSQAQTWEKMVVPGVTYREQVQWEPASRLVHILRINPGAPSLKLVPELALGKVFAVDIAKGREGVSAMVRRNTAIAGVNADFFQFSGSDPLGAMVREGQLLSTPDKRRATFGWGDGYAKAAKLEWSGKLFAENGIDMALDGVNQEAQDEQAVVYTNGAAKALALKPNCMIVCKFQSNSWTPDVENTGRVMRVASDSDPIPVDPDLTIIAARGSKGELLKQFAVGTKLVVKWTTKGQDWTKARNVVGGGPFLVVDGKPIIDAKTAGFPDSFSAKRHPRTAIGRTVDGDIILAVVDGRQSMSVGATLDEMAKIMMQQGCVEAINLDGGGSSTMNVLGLNLNRPSDGVEREVANGVLLYGRTNAATVEGLKLDGPGEIKDGTPLMLTVSDAQGKAVPQRDIYWSAMGSAWIDQTGTVRAFEEGRATIRAVVRGQVLSLDLVTHGKPPVAIPSEHPGLTPVPKPGKHA